MLPITECTGCNLCVQVCPFKAISMKENFEGFAIPQIDNNLCKECGLCVKKCPSINPLTREYPVETKLCVSKDENIDESASGGVFITIARFFISQLHGVVYGVIYTDDFSCRHAEAKTIDQLAPMQNSKYIQSEVGDIYVRAKQNLDLGKFVLFSGTPCQIAALKSFLGKDYDHLLTLEIVCHGVPNQRFWKKNLQHEAPETIHYKFRNRNNRRVGKTTLEGTSVTERGTKRIPWQNDPYYCSFIKNESFRESCYRCQYAKPERVADMTMGDCDSVKLYPDFYPIEAKSILLLNTSKGVSFWHRINFLFNFTQLNYEAEIIANTTLKNPSPRSQRRDSIYKDLEGLPWIVFKYKYSDRFTLRRLAGRIKMIVKKHIIHGK